MHHIAVHNIPHMQAHITLQCIASHSSHQHASNHTNPITMQCIDITFHYVVSLLTSDYIPSHHIKSHHITCITSHASHRITCNTSQASHYMHHITCITSHHMHHITSHYMHHITSLATHYMHHITMHHITLHQNTYVTLHYKANIVS